VPAILRGGPTGSADRVLQSPPVPGLRALCAIAVAAADRRGVARSRPRRLSAPRCPRPVRMARLPASEVRGGHPTTATGMAEGPSLAGAGLLSLRRGVHAIASCGTVTIPDTDPKGPFRASPVPALPLYSQQARRGGPRGPSGAALIGWHPRIQPSDDLQCRTCARRAPVIGTSVRTQFRALGHHHDCVPCHPSRRGGGRPVERWRGVRSARARRSQGRVVVRGWRTGAACHCGPSCVTLTAPSVPGSVRTSRTLAAVVSPPGGELYDKVHVRQRHWRADARPGSAAGACGCLSPLPAVHLLPDTDSR
jgi:hypothetical protein